MTTTSGSVYYHHDGLGNTIAITNGNADVLERYSYDAFGRVTIVDASTGNAIPQSAHGVRHFYTGHDFQAELGLYLTHYRAYEPVLGRWLSADPIAENGGWNLYGYVGNHNTMLTDPLGLCPVDEEGVVDDWLDGLQLGLDIAGLAPVIGEVADAANALLSLGRGDYIGAALSAAAMLPVGGQAATAAKLGRQAANSAKEAAKTQFRKEAAGLETKVIRSGRDGTGKIVGVGTKGRGGPTYRPKPDGSYSVGKKGDVKHYRPTKDGGHTVNQQ
jgi:RHS repeat-associated protein